MSLSRRALLAGAAAWSALPVSARAAGGADFVSCGRNGNGDFLAAGIDEDGSVRFRIRLPGRGHGFAFHPGRPECVVFARRPGSFAAVLDIARGRLLRWLEAAPGRHFYGHGAFSADGGRLFASENDYEAGRGVLGVYDTDDAYARRHEIPSHGIGPHEIRLMPDGQSLAVANGGIRTHPDHGRAKLNLASMVPNLSLLDISGGTLKARITLPPHLHQLSIRHLDLNRDGLVAIAMQYEGDRRRRVPLLGLWRPGRGIRLLGAPASVARRLRHYSGSVAFDRAGTMLALSHPRGHLVTLWDAGTGRYLTSVEAVDASGVAAGPVDGAFLVTSGSGKIGLIAPAAGTRTVPLLDAAPMAWDNHVCGHSISIGNT